MSENNGADNGRDFSTGQFLPGNAGKPRGSSKNKLRDEIKSFLNENWGNFPTWFGSLKAKEKVQCMLDLLPYAVPRLQNIAMTDSEGNDLPNQGMDLSRWSEADVRQLIALSQKYDNGN